MFSLIQFKLEDFLLFSITASHPPNPKTYHNKAFLSVSEFLRIIFWANCLKSTFVNFHESLKWAANWKKWGDPILDRQVTQIYQPFSPQQPFRTNWGRWGGGRLPPLLIDTGASVPAIPTICLSQLKLGVNLVSTPPDLPSFQPPCIFQKLRPPFPIGIKFLRCIGFQITRKSKFSMIFINCRILYKAARTDGSQLSFVWKKGETTDKNFQPVWYRTQMSNTMTSNKGEKISEVLLSFLNITHLCHWLGSAHRPLSPSWFASFVSRSPRRWSSLERSKARHATGLRHCTL